MTNDIVERLAKRAEIEGMSERTHPVGEVRWWLNAIADELEQHAENSISIPTRPIRSLGMMANWLRTQAGEASDE